MWKKESQLQERIEAERTSKLQTVMAQQLKNWKDCRFDFEEAKVFLI